MMPANQLRRKSNSLKIVKIDRNVEHEPTHLQFIMEVALFLFKRRGEKLSLSLFMSVVSKLRDQVSAG